MSPSYLSIYVILTQIFHNLVFSLKHHFLESSDCVIISNKNEDTSPVGCIVNWIHYLIIPQYLRNSNRKNLKYPQLLFFFNCIFCVSGFFSTSAAPAIWAFLGNKHIDLRESLVSHERKQFRAVSIHPICRGWKNICNLDLLGKKVSHGRTSSAISRNYSYWTLWKGF